MKDSTKAGGSTSTPTETTLQRRGLKDHEIAEIVNEIKYELAPFCHFGCLRQLIHNPLVKYLEQHNLRINHPNEERPLDPREVLVNMDYGAVERRLVAHLASGSMEKFTGTFTTSQKLWQGRGPDIQNIPVGTPESRLLKRAIRDEALTGASGLTVSKAKGKGSEAQKGSHKGPPSWFGEALGKAQLADSEATSPADREIWGVQMVQDLLKSCGEVEPASITLLNWRRMNEREHAHVLNAYLNITPDGTPCPHPGCLNHVTHPCECCGRIAGRKP